MSSSLQTNINSGMTVMWLLFESCGTYSRNTVRNKSRGRVRAVMSLFKRRQRMRGNYFSEVNIVLRFSYSSRSQTPSQSALTWSLHHCQQLMSCLSLFNHRFSPLITKQNQKAFKASEAPSKECSENYDNIKGMYGFYKYWCYFCNRECMRVFCCIYLWNV